MCFFGYYSNSKVNFQFKKCITKQIKKNINFLIVVVQKHYTRKTL